MGFDDRWLAKTLTQISANWYSRQTWLISMHCSQKTIHFVSVSNGPRSILLDIMITLRKSYLRIFLINHKYLQEMFLRRLRQVTEKTSFLRYARDVLKMSHKRHLFEMFLRRLTDIAKKDTFFEMYLRRLKDVTKKSSLLRYF